MNFWLCSENTEKYIIFLLSIEKDITRIDNNREEITKHLSCILQLIDSAQFRASSLSNLVNNLSDGIHRIKSNFGLDHKKCETCRIKYSIFLQCTKFKGDLIEYKCLCCKKIINTSLMKN